MYKTLSYSSRIRRLSTRNNVKFNRFLRLKIFGINQHKKEYYHISLLDLLLPIHKVYNISCLQYLLQVKLRTLHKFHNHPCSSSYSKCPLHVFLASWIHKIYLLYVKLSKNHFSCSKRTVSLFCLISTKISSSVNMCFKA